MTTLYFCADGILRIRSKNEKHMFGINFIQKQENLSDFKFWTQWWNQPAVFEKGLTFGQFFQCLEPWIEFWGDYTQKDLKAYLAELRKPTLIDKTAHTLDWLSLDFRSELRPKVNYPQEGLEFSQENIQPDTQWHLYSYYELTAYQMGKQEAILVEWTPVNLLANIPLVLNGQQLLMIDEFFINRYGKPEQHLINPHGLGVERIHFTDNNDGQFSYLEGSKTHTVREVVEGVFAAFDPSPQIRDELDAHLEEQYEEALENMEDTTVMDLDAIYEEQRSIISQHLDDEDPYFQNLLGAAKKSSHSYIRIGKIQEAQPLEKRILSWIK